MSVEPLLLLHDERYGAWKGSAGKLDGFTQVADIAVVERATGRASATDSLALARSSLGARLMDSRLD